MAYMSFDIKTLGNRVQSSPIHSDKKVIFGCITRKALSQQTEVYSSYIRFGVRVPDEVRLQIAPFYLVPNNLSPASPNPGRM